MKMNKAREIQKQITRPTSAVIMLLLFEGFTNMFPDAMSLFWQGWTYRMITAIGATGIIDKVWRNRREIREFIINIFKNKKDDRTDES